jgi:hypothetical protein
MNKPACVLVAEDVGGDALPAAARSFIFPSPNQTEAAMDAETHFIENRLIGLCALNSDGARRSRRFYVQNANRLRVSCVTGCWTLKRRERRAP